jgi:hypothetical protein
MEVSTVLVIASAVIIFMILETIRLNKLLNKLLDLNTDMMKAYQDLAEEYKALIEEGE